MKKYLSVVILLLYIILSVIDVLLLKKFLENYNWIPFCLILLEWSLVSILTILTIIIITIFNKGDWNE